jgi:hypothetical protein
LGQRTIGFFFRNVNKRKQIESFGVWVTETPFDRDGTRRSCCVAPSGASIDLVRNYCFAQTFDLDEISFFLLSVY